jgi:hypothetical protein
MWLVRLERAGRSTKGSTLLYFPDSLGLPLAERKSSHHGVAQRIAAAGLRPPPMPVL